MESTYSMINPKWGVPNGNHMNDDLEIVHGFTPLTLPGSLLLFRNASLGMRYDNGLASVPCEVPQSQAVPTSSLVVSSMQVQRGEAWDIWSRGVTSGRQKVDTWRVAPVKGTHTPSNPNPNVCARMARAFIRHVLCSQR